MYWKFKLPLIIVLLGVLVLLCMQAGKAFQQRTAKEKQQLQEAQGDSTTTETPAPQSSPEVKAPSSDAPKQVVSSPKPFTVDEIPDSQEGKNAKPTTVAQETKPATVAQTPAAPAVQTATQPLPVAQETKPAQAAAATTAASAQKAAASAQKAAASAQKAAAPAQATATTAPVPAQTAAAPSQTTAAPAQAATTTAPAQAAVPAKTTAPAPAQAAAAVAPAVQTAGSTPSAPQIATQFQQIQDLIAKKEYIAARTAALAILNAPGVKEYDATWRKAAQSVSDINKIFVTSNTPCPEKQTYVVKSGDVLVRIAYYQKTTAQALMNMNRIKDPRRLWEGQKLAYISGDWSIKVSKSQFLLALYHSGTLFRIFKVGIGKDNRTPVGTFEIRDKVINPAWDSPEGRIPPSDPRNILGTRWMGLEATGNTSTALTGYGIHGTTLPETVGTPSSAGCVRLKNEDVEDLFNLIPDPAAAKVPVTIVE